MTLKAIIVLLNSNWTGIARLPYALSKAGWEVASFSTEDSFLAKTRYVQKRYKLDIPNLALTRLAQAINDFKPDLLIPGCEETVRWFHNIALLNESDASTNGISLLQKIILASLGSSECYDITLSKSSMHTFATHLGLRTPPQMPATTVKDAQLAANAIGYPVVLKGEHGSAGSSVRICHTESEINNAYQELLTTNSKQKIDIQKYIDGEAAMCTGVVKEGTLLNSFFALKLHTHPLPTSPCSVARLSNSSEAQFTLSTLVQHLKFNGFCSCDFIVEKNTQMPYLLEFNPRPTPISALGHIFRHDLCVALAEAWGYISNQPSIPHAYRDTIALFPNEWMRDFTSPYLTSAYHDVPWHDPKLLKAYIDFVIKP